MSIEDTEETYRHFSSGDEEGDDEEETERTVMPYVIDGKSRRPVTVRFLVYDVELESIVRSLARKKTTN